MIDFTDYLIFFDFSTSALGVQGGPSAPRVEHRYYSGSFETLILVFFDLIFAMKPPNFLKNLKISLKKKKKCETLDGFNEIHEMVSRVSKKRPIFKNTLVYRAKIRPMWSNFTAI